MTITARTCANCAAFIEDSIAEPSSCLNLVSFIISPGKSREPIPTDTCDAHKTHQEDADETAFIDANRAAIWDCIKAQVATQELLGKLRKVGAQ